MHGSKLVLPSPDYMHPYATTNRKYVLEHINIIHTYDNCNPSIALISFKKSLTKREIDC